MTNETFDQAAWERRWEKVLREHPDKVARRPSNAHLLAEAGDLAPGLALDAGCGHGAEAIWLASAGWRVTAVDFSSTALDHARSTADAAGADVAERIAWVEGDLTNWAPPPRRFDLVSCLYVHVAGSVGELVTRLGAGVAPGGTLFLVGHRPVDPVTGEPTPAARQVQVSVEDALGALDTREWQILVAEERPRASAGTGVDAVVRAVYRPWLRFGGDGIDHEVSGSPRLRRRPANCGTTGRRRAPLQMAAVVGKGGTRWITPPRSGACTTS